MNIHNLSCLFLLSLSSLLHTSPFATRLMLTNTEETKQSHTDHLFIQAKKSADDYINARSQCLQTHDCITNKEYRNARKLVISSITDLIIHIDTYDDDDATHTHEKNEAENIKNQLIQLLESTDKK